MIIQLIHLPHPSKWGLFPLNLGVLFFQPKASTVSKGRKVKPGDSFVDKGKAEESLNDLTDPRLAAKERANRPNQMTADLLSEENRGLVNC